MKRRTCSAVEIELRVLVWFHLSRVPNRSRLVVLGDRNQQMTPTGFHWVRLLCTFSEQSNRYGCPRDEFLESARFTADETDTRTPLRLLPNTYRLTSEVARFAQSMWRAVVTRNEPASSVGRLLEDVVDPDLTLELRTTDRVQRLPEEMRRPVLVVCEPGEFVEALAAYADGAAEPDLASFGGTASDRVTAAGSALVVLTHPGEALDRLQRDRGADLATVVQSVPLAFCKGLEFEGCVVFGLPVREGRPEPDVRGQWYTALTRAAGLLLVCVSPTEHEYLQRVGWSEIPESDVTVERVAGLPEAVQAIQRQLARVGATTLTPEVLQTLGESYFTRFTETRDENFLRIAIRNFKLGGRPDLASSYALEAGKLLEKWDRHESAAQYFEVAEQGEDAVRCLLRLCSRGEGKYYEKARALTAEMHRKGYVSGAIGCWLGLAKLDPVNLTEAVEGATSELDAALWERLEGEVRRRLDSDSPASGVSTRLAEALALRERFVVASLCWEGLGQPARGIECLVRAGRPGEALTVAETSLPAGDPLWVTIGQELEKAGETAWPSAFRCYHRAQDRARRNGLADRLRMPGLARCWMDLGDKHEARMLASSCTSRGLFADAAACWEVVGQPGDAARCWSRASSLVLEESDDHLGPADVSRGAACRRFLQHLRSPAVTNQSAGSDRPDGNAEDVAKQCLAMMAGWRSNREWRRNVRQWLRRLERQANDCLGLEGEQVEGRLTDLAEELGMHDPGEVREMVRRVAQRYAERARKCAETLFQTPGREVEAVSILDQTLKRRREALAWTQQLWDRDTVEGRALAINAWRRMKTPEPALKCVEPWHRADTEGRQNETRGLIERLGLDVAVRDEFLRRLGFEVAVQGNAAEMAGTDEVSREVAETASHECREAVGETEAEDPVVGVSNAVREPDDDLDVPVRESHAAGADGAAARDAEAAAQGDPTETVVDPAGALVEDAGADGDPAAEGDAEAAPETCDSGGVLLPQWVRGEVQRAEVNEEARVDLLKAVDDMERKQSALAKLMRRIAEDLEEADLARCAAVVRARHAQLSAPVADEGRDRSRVV